MEKIGEGVDKRSVIMLYYNHSTAENAEGVFYDSEKTVENR